MHVDEVSLHPDHKTFATPFLMVCVCKAK